MEKVSIQHSFIGEVDHLDCVPVCRAEDVLNGCTIATVTREMTSIFHTELGKVKQAMNGRQIEIAIKGKYGRVRVVQRFKVTDGKALVSLLPYTVEPC